MSKGLSKKRLDSKIGRRKRRIFLDKKYCCGCSACFSVCPISAIEMKEDHEGFLYPIISVSDCIQCNQCINVCPMTKPVD